MTSESTRKRWLPADDPKGVVCPKCGCAHLPVLNTRRSMGRIVRYRQCRHCGRRVTTYEVTPSKLADVTAQNPGKPE